MSVPTLSDHVCVFPVGALEESLESCLMELKSQKAAAIRYFESLSDSDVHIAVPGGDASAHASSHDSEPIADVGTDNT